MNLEDAAKEVGIAKKSLDDYLLQIRFGKKFGFNFQDHRDHRVGVLRAYVKHHKSLTKDLDRMNKAEARTRAYTERHEQGTSQCKGINCCTPEYLDDYIQSS
jgi:hypothetical protein